MCGIVGIIGRSEAQREILTGLSKLEYRGYDSAGMFLLDQENKGHLFRAKGRIADLEALVDAEFETHFGIGHTRWATHGPAQERNAHPHVSQSGRFAIVHNGVIENYLELKENYLENWTFKSDTDTEVLVNLIEKFVIEERFSTLEAMQKALKLVHGSYAIGLIDIEDADHLYAAKNKSPLLVGLGDGFNVIASDAMATIHLTHQYLEIKDGEVLVLAKDKVELQDLEGNVLERPPYQADIDDSDLDKGAYKYYMLKEIDEQPAVIRRNLQDYFDDRKVKIDNALLEKIQASDRIYIVACGTSYHAGWIGKHYFETFLSKPTEVLIASEFAYHTPLLSSRPFFIFISQSGETADSRQAMLVVKEMGHPVLTITNVKGSTLSREADFTLLINAGPEIAVASTKAYTAQITVLAILAHALAQENGTAKYDMEHQLSLVATGIERVLVERESLQEWVQSYLRDKRNAFYIGRYLDYYLAMEAALKLKEISYIQTEAFASGELKHGTIALIEEGTPVIAIITDETTAANTRSNLEEVKARGAKTMVIASENLAKDDDDFVIQSVEPGLAPLVGVVVTQMIAYFATLDRGLDVDKPRNLAKSVTVE